MALLALGACTEPLYSTDGGDDAGSTQPSQDGDAGSDGDKPFTPAMSDGGPCEGAGCMEAGAGDAQADAEPISLAPDGGLDPVRSIWAGRYATRSFLYSWDGLVESTARLLTLAEIKPLPDGGLVLEEEQCLWEGGWSFIIVSQLRLVFPGTKATAELTFTEQRFDSKVAKAMVGYGPAPSGCTSGVASVQASPEQVWNTNNSCDCPRNAEVPSSARDCRITDADKDQKPAFTFNVTIGSSRFDYHVTQEESTRLLSGYKIGEKLFADREWLDKTRVVGCVVDGVAKRTADCPLGGGFNCPARHNKAELVKLDDPKIGCAEIIQREVGLFSPLNPLFPAACAGDLGI